MVRGRLDGLSVTTFHEFLFACKEVERHGAQREAGDMLDGDYVRGRTPAMWMQWEEVAVCCDSAVGQPSWEFVNPSQQVAWRTPEDVVRHRIRQPAAEGSRPGSGRTFRELTPEREGR